jgi:hypothetical protein
MAFTTSGVFTAFIAGAMGGSGSDGKKMPSSYTGLGANALKVALYGNSGTPDKNAAYGLTGYNAATSAWVTGNEVSGTNWAAGGVALSGAVGAVSSSTFKFDANDTASGGATTLSNVYGSLLYDDDVTSTNTVADQGVCFNYFGGAQSVTSGTFTVVWNASGIFTITTS